MPQVLKDDVRERIRRAALDVFAKSGFVGATMGAIAARAEVATANVYRYYPSKDELLDAVVSHDLAREHEALVARSVRSLAHLAHGTDGPRDADPTAGEELLRFWIDHRLEVVLLLDRAAGTPYAPYGERFVEKLVAHTLSLVRGASPGARVPPPARLVLTHVFENTRRTIASILETHSSPRAIREGVDAFRAYQVAGLAGFAAWVASATPR